MTDLIRTLPKDEHPVSHSENEFMRIVDRIKPSNNKQVGQHDKEKAEVHAERQILHKLFDDLRLPIVASILFFVLNTSSINNIVLDMVPYSKKGPLHLTITKTFIFAIIIFGLVHLV